MSWHLKDRTQEKILAALYTDFKKSLDFTCRYSFREIDPEHLFAYVMFGETKDGHARMTMYVAYEEVEFVND